MKSKASAPAKVILFGEHFVVYGVKAILCAINKRITVTAEIIDENKIVVNSNIGDLELQPNKEISEIDSPLKPFYYLANKLIQNPNTGIKDYCRIRNTIRSRFGFIISLLCSRCCSNFRTIQRNQPKKKF